MSGPEGEALVKVPSWPALGTGQDYDVFDGHEVLSSFAQDVLHWWGSVPNRSELPNADVLTEAVKKLGEGIAKVRG